MGIGAKRAIDSIREVRNGSVFQAQNGFTFQKCTVKVPICRILASGPFSLQPYYSRGENVKFYSTSHVNTFLMMTNYRRERRHSEKAPQSSKTKIVIFSFFFTF